MTVFANRAKVATATTGTGAITLGLAVSGYASFQEAGISDGDVVSYVLEDGTSFEVGHGTYDADTLTLTRTVLLSKVAGEVASISPLSLSGSAVVFLTALAEDLSEFAILDDAVSFDKVGIGGATADATNRLSVNSPAVLFNHDGASSQVKVNKATTGYTASILFQNDFDARAEIGLVGDDDFVVKVSPDGDSFIEGIRIDKDDGTVTFPSGVTVPDAWSVLANSAAAVSHTGDTSETDLAAIILPANAMGANGAVKITTLWSSASGGAPGNRTARVRFGSTSMLNVNLTSGAPYYSDQHTVYNRNNAASQVSVDINSPAGGFGSSAAGAPETASIDTTAAVTIHISGQLANAGDTITLEAYMVEVLQRG